MKSNYFLIQQIKAKAILLVFVIVFLNTLPLLTGCSTDKNTIEAYRVTWWHVPNIEGSKTGNFGRPDFGVIDIDNGELNLRHAILEGRDLGDYTLPYWPIRSFVSIFSKPIEIAHRCTLTVNTDNKTETFLFRTGDPSLTHSVSFKRGEEGFELARIKDGDVLKVTNRGSDSPVLMEHFFIVEKGRRNIPIYIKATNITDKKIEDVEVGITYSQDFNWSSFGVSDSENYQQAAAPMIGNAKAFYAFSSGMESGLEFQVNKGCELSYQLNEEFNAWEVSIKNTPASLEPGGSFIFTYNLAVIDEPLEEITLARYISDIELEELEFASKIPVETRTAPIDLDNRVTIQDVIEALEEPKVRGVAYIGGPTAYSSLDLLKAWGGNLAITRSNDPDLVAYGHEQDIEMLLRGAGSFTTGAPLSFSDYFTNDDIRPEGIPSSYGQDEDHYYWYPVIPTLDFEKEFGKSKSEATLDEKVEYWSRCFVDKWRLQLDHIREYDPDGDIWFYMPSPGMPYIDPFDYYDMFFSEVSKLGEKLTVLPFYYGKDFDMPEYMMRRWKDAGIHRAVFLPGGPTYARPSQFIEAITSARRGGADGACGFSFIVTEENFDDEWRWKSIMLASLANFPTPELDAYCFIEEPAELIKKLAISEVNVITAKSDAQDLTEKLEAFLPGKVRRLDQLPENRPQGQIYVVVGDNSNFEQNQWAYNAQRLERGKGVMQMSGNVVSLNGADTKGLENAKELFLRFAEIGMAESKCNQMIEASGIRRLSETRN